MSVSSPPTSGMAEVQTAPIMETVAPAAAPAAAPITEQQVAAPIMHVPVPDLSMELQEQLKRSFTELETNFSAALPEGKEEIPAMQTASAQAFAGSAVSEAIRIFKQFNAEASKEALSETIHSIVHSDSLIGHLAERSQAALRDYIPHDRAVWLAHDIEGHATSAKIRLGTWRATAVRTACLVRMKGGEVIFDKRTHVIVLSAGGGALLLGSTAGVAGVCGGMTSGALAGLVPALFTLGLSIPAGAAVGGSVGGLLGTAAGTMTGFIGGGAAGGVAYRYRVEIRNGALLVRVKVLDAKAKAAKAVQQLHMKVANTAETAKSHGNSTLQMISDKSSEVACRAQACMHVAATSAQTKASDLGAGAKSLALNPAVQVTSAAAAGGAVATGAAGGSLGLVAGGATGAAVGLVPALFTFGLSIPVCAVIGSGTGACLGTAAGGTAGMVGGGAMGYGAYGACARRQEIKETAVEAWTKVGMVAESVKLKAKEKANISASFVKTSLGGTGGTQ